MKNLRNNLYEYVEGFLGLLFPNDCITCNATLSSQDEFFCFRCRGELHYTYFEKYDTPTIADHVFWGRLNIDSIYSMLYFSQGNSTQEILHEIKYLEGRDLGIYMGKMMGERMKTMPCFSTVDAIIPIPIHSMRAFSRGYNQSLLIAQGLSEVLNVHIVDALYRVKNDKSQTRKSREERYQNVKDRFALKKKGLQNQNHVLIVDDVLTTGATLEFASRAVLTAKTSPKISIATIAITDR